MSGLVAFALGLCAQQALKGRTWAQDRVLFEPASPVDPSAPVIAIYVGRGYGKGKGRDTLDASAFATLRFEMFLPAAFSAAGLTFESDSAQALGFACLGRQIQVAFHQGASVWANLWNVAMFDLLDIEGARDLFENEKKQKLAVAVEEWRFSTLAEPKVGQAPEGFWADFVAAMTAAGGELATLAPLITAQVQGTATVLADWQTDASRIGATPQEMAAIGLTPLPDDVFTTSDGRYADPPLQEAAVSANDDDLVGL